VHTDGAGAALIVAAATAGALPRVVLMTAPIAALELRNVSKSFGELRALSSINLTLARGEVHAMVGQNGSGKSTIVKILAGYHRPDRGSEILLNGRAVRRAITPAAMREAGVSFVHQDLGLIPEKTVAENIGVGAFRHARLTRRIDWRAEEQTAARLLSRLDRDIDPRALVGALGAADRSIVAIARALRAQRGGDGVIVFDESTKALPKHALDDFYQAVRSLTASGGSVLLISHNLDEAISVADRLTVLRDGVVVASAATSDVSARDIARHMLGHELAVAIPQAPKQPRGSGQVEVRGLRGRVVHDVDLSIGAGEIVGVTGLAGAGWEELPYLLSGALPATAGSIEAGGAKLTLRRASVSACLRFGVTLIPEDRARAGLALTMPILTNLSLPWVTSRGRRHSTGAQWQRSLAQESIVRFNIRPPDMHRTVGQLSGGNQQKVLLAKWLAKTPALLAIHEPTQAVDIGAREDIHAAIRAIAEQGAAVLIASIQANELSALCDVVYVLRDGVIVDKVTNVEQGSILDSVYARHDAPRAGAVAVHAGQPAQGRT
jgi:ribose transport system ATP-binding protein